MNIELHGFLPEHARSIMEEVWSKLLANRKMEQFWDDLITVVGDETHDHNYRNTPFFRVYSSEVQDFDGLAEMLRPIRMPGAGMETYIECVLLTRRVKL